MKKNLKSYFWKLLVSLLLILFLLRFVNQKEMAELLKNIRWPYLIGYFALNFFDRLIMAYKWKILLDAKEIPCSWEKLIVVYFKGTFLGNLFPTSLGGDAIRAYELSRNTKTGIDVVSSIIMERFLGFLSSAVMAIMVIPLLFFFVPDFYCSAFSRNKCGIIQFLQLIPQSKVLCHCLQHALHYSEFRFLSAQCNAQPGFFRNSCFAFWFQLNRFSQFKNLLRIGNMLVCP